MPIALDAGTEHSMPKCPQCGRPMATVLQRKGGEVRTDFECPYCHDEGHARQVQQANPDDDQRMEVPDGQDPEGEGSKPVEDA